MGTSVLLELDVVVNGVFAIACRKEGEALVPEKTNRLSPEVEKFIPLFPKVASSPLENPALAAHSVPLVPDAVMTVPAAVSAAKV